MDPSPDVKYCPRTVGINDHGHDQRQHPVDGDEELIKAIVYPLGVYLLDRGKVSAEAHEKDGERKGGTGTEGDVRDEVWRRPRVGPPDGVQLGLAERVERLLPQVRVQEARACQEHQAVSPAPERLVRCRLTVPQLLFVEVGEEQGENDTGDYPD